MEIPKKFNSLVDIHKRLSTVEGDKNDIKIIISKIPLLSFISYVDINNRYDRGGILVDVHKTYFKLITDLENINSITKIKFSNIKKIYYVNNPRSYYREYQIKNKDKKKNAIEDIISRRNSVC